MTNTYEQPPVIDTAVVMCGGVASRDLPHSLIRPNTLGEIGDRNAFDIITEDLAAVGIKNLVVVIPDIKAYPNVNMTRIQISTWFHGNPKLQAELAAKGKNQDIVDRAGPHNHGVEKLYFAEQGQDSYGTAAALGAAVGVLDKIEPEGFVVVNGDGFMYREDGGSDIGDLIEAVNYNRATHGLLTAGVEKQTTGKYPYGIIERDKDGDFVRINEGPQAVDVKTDTPEGNVGVYVFGSAIIPRLRDYLDTPISELPSPEYWLTDVVSSAAASNEPVLAKQAVGRFVDCATNDLRLRALNVIDPSAFQRAQA